MTSQFTPSTVCFSCHSLKSWASTLFEVRIGRQVMHRSCFSLIPLRPATVWRQWSHPTAPLTCAWIDNLRPPSQSGCTPCRFSRDAEACAELTVNSSMTLGLLVCREEVKVKSWTIGRVFFFYLCETDLWSAFICHSLIHLFLAWICPCTLALSPLVCQRKKEWTYSVVWTHCLDELDAAAALKSLPYCHYFYGALVQHFVSLPPHSSPGDTQQLSAADILLFWKKCVNFLSRRLLLSTSMQES